MLIVKCHRGGPSFEDGKPCIMFAAKVVRPIEKTDDKSEKIELEEVIHDFSLPCPPAERKLALVPYPGGSSPTVIFDGWKAMQMFRGPMVFAFWTYDTDFDAALVIEKVFSIREM